MFLTRKHMNRRAVLKAAGVTLGRREDASSTPTIISIRPATMTCSRRAGAKIYRARLHAPADVVRLLGAGGRSL